MVSVAEKESAPNQRYIVNDEIAKLQDPLTDLSLWIISKGRVYDLILGDDTSARIPTLVLGKVLNAHNDRMGNPHANIRFVKGLYAEAEFNCVLETLPSKPHSALLVTEYVVTGDTIRKFNRLLTERGINYDLAVVALANKYCIRNNNYTNLFYFRGKQELPPLIYRKPQLTGLSLYGKYGKPTPVRGLTVGERDKILRARQDIKILAERIIADFRK